MFFEEKNLYLSFSWQGLENNILSEGIERIKTSLYLLQWCWKSRFDICWKNFTDGRGRRDALQWACKSFMLSIKNLLNTYSFCLSLGVGWCYMLSLISFTTSSFFCHCFLPHPFIPLLGLLSFPQNLSLLAVSLSLASQIYVQFSWLCFLS